MNATTPDEDAMALGMRLAEACAPAFVRAFLSSLSGMAEQAIGYQASREVLTFVADLKPVGTTHPLQ